LIHLLLIVKEFGQNVLVLNWNFEFESLGLNWKENSSALVEWMALVLEVFLLRGFEVVLVYCVAWVLRRFFVLDLIDVQIPGHSGFAFIFR
jgi:hypothetical protein